METDKKEVKAGKISTKLESIQQNHTISIGSNIKLVD
jgi:hypothetical protein